MTKQIETLKQQLKTTESQQWTPLAERDLAPMQTPIRGSSIPRLSMRYIRFPFTPTLIYISRDSTFFSYIRRHPITTRRTVSKNSSSHFIHFYFSRTVNRLPPPSVNRNVSLECEMDRQRVNQERMEEEKNKLQRELSEAKLEIHNLITAQHKFRVEVHLQRCR